MGGERRVRGTWDVGTRELKRAITIAPSDPERRSRQRIIGLDGNYNCCDFWLRVPLDNVEEYPGEAGWGDVILELWANDGTAQTLLDRKRARDHEGVLLPQRGETFPAAPFGRRRINAILLSARARPCDSFVVKARVPELPQGYTSYAKADCMLECWGSDTANPNDLQGRTITDPFAPRSSTLDKYTELVAGDNIVLTRPGTSPFPDDDRRLYLTHLSIDTDAGALREITLYRLDITGAIRTVVMKFWLNNARWVSENFTKPQRGEPGGDWVVEILNPVPAATYHCNTVGFIE